MMLAEYIFYSVLTGGVAFPRGDMERGNLAMLQGGIIWGQRFDHDWWLEVRHPANVSSDPQEGGFTLFTTIYGAYRSMGEGVPNKKCTLLLEGDTDDHRAIHARLSFNPDNMLIDEMQFSPVPFGPDGRPRLVISSMFLEIVAVLLRTPPPDGWWSYSKLYKTLMLDWARLPSIPQPADLNYILELQIARDRKDKGLAGEHILPCMTPERFEEIFGVKLPE